MFNTRFNAFQVFWDKYNSEKQNKEYNNLEVPYGMYWRARVCKSVKQGKEAYLR